MQFPTGFGRRAASLLLMTLTGGQLASTPAYADESVTAPAETMVVTASRQPAPQLNTLGNIAVLGPDDIKITGATHPYDLGVRVPGVWISRGSGQEHLTAIRSPVLTGPGSCGAFLVMEDGIPTRPAGFCNANQLFEVADELASDIEVIRGPANALYGSNGLHGTINVLLPTPGKAAGTQVSLMGGSNQYRRGQTRWDSGPGSNAFSAGLLYDRDGGYQAESGYNQAKLFGKSAHELAGGTLTFSGSGSWLDQDTAGFITGKDAYKQADRFRNDNPEAYRKAYSVRLSSAWLPESSGVWTPEYRFYLRNSEMRFLQHFLPTKPNEQNGQTSGGVMFVARRDWWRNSVLTAGLDAEIATGYLDEYQDPQYDRPFLPSRPAGKHYDYDVNSYMTAAFASLQMPLDERWELQAGLRSEFMLYDYSNNMLDGNTRADGEQCTESVADFPPDGCLYFRPPDRTDNFFNVSPNLGVLYKFTNATVGFANFTSGFRAPQAAELYRLQAEQNPANIDSERLDSVEVGTRHQGEKLRLENVAFYMRKSNAIFRDSADVNVSDGRTKHYGIESNIDWRITDPVYLSLTGSFAKQIYDFDRAAAQGEIITKGNEIDTSPQVLGSARLGYEQLYGIAELEWVYQDEYFLDAANTASYGGHDLLNLRLLFKPSQIWTIALRINNLTNVRYADRADLLSSVDPPSYRYFPGHDREVYVELTWNTPDT